jgi:hypothetical protein
VSNCTAIKRGKSMETWAYGTMTPVGSRVPQGGRPGDVYGPYSQHSAATIEGIHTLFRHAHVSTSIFNCIFINNLSIRMLRS